LTLKPASSISSCLCRKDPMPHRRSDRTTGWAWLGPPLYGMPHRATTNTWPQVGGAASGCGRHHSSPLVVSASTRSVVDPNRYCLPFSTPVVAMSGFSTAGWSLSTPHRPVDYASRGFAARRLSRYPHVSALCDFIIIRSSASPLFTIGPFVRTRALWKPPFSGRAPRPLGC